ncbi:MAG TPA: uracil-DNA glycosylase [Gammaproteobacteria bacterium]|nr:uracil-DNA glycosylase [Gammaproteobacteria bacterium]
MTTIHPLNLSNIHTSWQACLQQGLTRMDPQYLAHLQQTTHWLPGHHNIFNAFSLPLDQVNYILIGESPYPRQQSANGYAFWDANVQALWSTTGLSKTVNRATSLRNMIKMLLIAENLLDKNHLSQTDIAQLDKQNLIQTNQQLFQRLLEHGFLLLNATLVLQQQADDTRRQDAEAWQPFIKEILHCLIETKQQVTFLLLGQIANKIDKLLPNNHKVKKLYAEHPYNLSFIQNKEILDFFRPMHLLVR